MSLIRTAVSVSFTVVILQIFVASSFIYQPNLQTRLVSSVNAKKSVEEETKELLEKAKKLRDEVSVITTAKRNKVLEIEEKEQKIVNQKEKLRLRYSVEIPILKGDGSEKMERVDFQPRFAGEKSFVTTIQAQLPLGIILGEYESNPGIICVDDVNEGSNGEKSGVRVGDLLRACTACKMTMETPTWQLLAGGIGTPKTARMIYSVDGRPFEEVMEAVSSNRMDPEERPTWLVLERDELN